MNNYYRNNKDDYDNNNYNNTEDYINLQSKDNIRLEDEPNSNMNIFAQFTDNMENREYLTIVSKGFVWIFMFVVSFFTLFLIFKTPYYLYYDQTKPLKIQQSINSINDLIDTSSSYNKNISNQFAKENLKKPIQNLPNKDVSSNKDKNFSLETNKSDQNINSSKPTQSVKKNDNKISSSDSDITSLLKKNTITSNKLNLSSQEKTYIKSSPYVNNSNSISSSMTANTNKKQSLSEDIKTNEPIGKVWVVNIFSSSKKELLYNKLAQLKFVYSGILNDNLSYYFTTNLVNNAYSYRIALGNKDNGYFSTSLAAKNFCLILKKSDLDCFISEISYKDLSASITK